MVDWFLPMHRSFSVPPSRDGRYLFGLADGREQWLVMFAGNEVGVRRERGEADVRVEASASDILLFLWRHLPPDRLSTSGNRDLLARYHDLAPGA